MTNIEVIRNIEFIRFVNKNGFTHICCNCTVPNGECLDIAKQGRCKVYEDRKFKKLWNGRAK